MNLTVLQAVYRKDSPVFLDECFSSLANQTRPADAIVLVKDGLLTPELDDVIAVWSESLPLKVIGYEENRGLASALNFGLQFVTTDLVARMDSDDIALPDRFKNQLEYFEKRPSTEILGGAITEFYISATGKRFERVRRYPITTNKSSRSLYKGTPLAHPTVMMKTEILKRYQYRTDTQMNEDIDLWFRLISEGIELQSLYDPVLKFRITDGTFHRRSLSKACSEMNIYISNCRKLFGFSPLLIFPVIRFITRLFPYNINKMLYFSKLRKMLFNNR